MQMIDRLLDVNRMSRPGTKIGTIKKITIHWVGNAKSTAIANRNYFNNLKNQNVTYASAHYIIGLEGEVIRCVPENEVAYHGNSHNCYAIGIENCHPDWEGKFNEKTYKSLIELCAELCIKYKLNPITDIERHYDITGKDCPHYYVVNESAWNAFKKDVDIKMKEGDEVVKQEEINVNGANIVCDVIMKDGVTYMPMRQIAEILGAEVTYDSKTKKKGIKIARA